MKQNSVPSNKELAAFIDKHSWHNQMCRSKGIDSFSNYSGPDHGHAVVVVGMTRDSDLLSISNFECALERLGGESPTVEVLSMGHWACGWIKLLTVNPQDRKALIEAYTIKRELDEYPVLDDDDFSEREYEAFSNYAEESKQDLAKALCAHFGLPESVAASEEMLDLAYCLNLECQFHAGADSCINVYDCREPDESDLARLESVMRQMRYDRQENEAFKYIAACLNMQEEA